MYTLVHTIVIFVDITVHPRRNFTVLVGTNVALICKASGADNLKYQWMRIGEKTIPSRAIAVDKSSLIIRNIMVDDSGEYQCVVSSGNVSVTSRPGIVSVFSVLSKLLIIMYFHAMHYRKEHRLNNFLVSVKDSSYDDMRLYL